MTRTRHLLLTVVLLGTTALATMAAAGDPSQEPLPTARHAVRQNVLVDLLFLVPVCSNDATRVADSSRTAPPKPR